MNPYIGKTLGAYQIIEQIGQGGMATVFKAYHPAMDRYVALKILPSHFTQDETFVARFTQEARTLARLEHPHILPVYDYGEQDGITYLVMRYIDAGTLNDLILERGALDLKQTTRIMGQVARALGYAHSQGVIHRDIKPSNVLIDDQGNAFLTDFGIAKIVAGSSRFTGTGVLIGTPAYMSPEQGRGQEIDHRCDIYALGVMLYEMVTGHVPFDAETPLAVLMKHVNDPLPLPRQVVPNLPEILERVILKALAKLPDDRFQTAEEMAETLEKAVSGLPTDVALPPLPGGATAVMQPPSLDRAPAVSHPEDPTSIPVSEPDLTPTAESVPQKRKLFPWLLVIGGVVALAIIVLAAIFILPDLLGGRGDVFIWQESVVDNASAYFYVEEGDWETCLDSECQGFSYGADFLYAQPGCTECVVRFDFEVPLEDSYTIWVWWPKGDDRATDTPFTISYGDDALTVNVDQRNNGNQWYELATVYLEEDDFVEIYVAGTDTGYANADAVGLKLDGDGPPLDPGPYLILPGPNGIVVDNVDSNFSLEGDWDWCDRGDCGGLSYGVDFRYASPECTDCFAYFYFDIVQDGDYDVWSWWPKGDDRGTDTPFVISHDDDELTVNVDQRNNGDTWYKLATLSLEQGDSLFVIVWTTETGYANADAVALTRADNDTSGALDEDDAVAAPDDEVRDFTVGMITDLGGIDDKSFNATSWEGVDMAIEKWGVEGNYLESQQQTDYATNIAQLINQDIDLIVTVGFLLADDTAKFAIENPDVNFAIVDHAYDPPIANVRGLIFNIDEAAFLAGYVAASATKTGKVATFGGINIPPVTAFMIGFEYGVMYYNEQMSADVEVLGWNSKEGNGLFVGNFESTDDGRRVAEEFLAEGADIIMPVAGPVGLGTAQAVKEHGDAWIIGVDMDWSISVPEYADIILTSVLKNMDIAVFTTIRDASAPDFDGFDGGIYVGTLENGGVDLANVAGVVDLDALDAVKQALINGEIDLLDIVN